MTVTSLHASAPSHTVLYIVDYMYYQCGDILIPFCVSCVGTDLCWAWFESGFETTAQSAMSDCFSVIIYMRVFHSHHSSVMPLEHSPSIFSFLSSSFPIPAFRPTLSYCKRQSWEWRPGNEAGSGLSGGLEMRLQVKARALTSRCWLFEVKAVSTCNSLCLLGLLAEITRDGRH